MLLHTATLGSRTDGNSMYCVLQHAINSENVKNAQLAEPYLQLVKKRYSEPGNEKILGSFITVVFPKPSTSHSEEQAKVYNGAKKKQKDSQPN